MSSEPFTFIFSWYLSGFALSWFGGGVSAQPQTLLWVLGHVQHKPGDELDELTAPLLPDFQVSISVCDSNLQYFHSDPCPHDI